MRTSAVRTSVGGGECPPRPEISSRGRAAPPRPSSERTATARRASGECFAKWATPSDPYAPASVERNTSVWRGVRADSVVPAVAYARASSTSAAVPLAFAFAPALSPLLSR